MWFIVAENCFLLFYFKRYNNATRKRNIEMIKSKDISPFFVLKMYIEQIQTHTHTLRKNKTYFRGYLIIILKISTLKE